MKVDPAVVAVIKAWAKAPARSAAAVLEDGRRRLDAALLPLLLAEVAEITADQLLGVLDLPSEARKGEQPVDFIGVPLNQMQATRAQGWLEEQAETAKALGLALDVWTKHLQAGFLRSLERLRGGPSAAAAPQGTSAEVARAFLGAEAPLSAERADPRTSDKAGLRGVLAARAFDKKQR